MFQYLTVLRRNFAPRVGKKGEGDRGRACVTPAELFRLRRLRLLPG